MLPPNQKQDDGISDLDLVSAPGVEEWKLTPKGMVKVETREDDEDNLEMYKTSVNLGNQKTPQKLDKKGSDTSSEAPSLLGEVNQGSVKQVK